ncbi:MAG: N-acetyl-gamma-glutamyl-phosphate reductase [Candidatus Omnitrophota bacterium]|jgi:N-acetyl-gamma-glutamyl-phosphate reductase|nr:MAG: N-acetyl-gamma-glutamyl-phosphate reductase [Candidatus Omnitrophota bacterium]
MNEQKKCRVKIVGGTGYTGGEIIRLLLNHPLTEIVAITGAGIPQPQPAWRFWGWLRGVCDIPIAEETPGEGGNADVVFLSTPHGVSMKLAPLYYEKSHRVIDLSADYRFEDVSEREGWYADEHTSPELCKEAVYGMPELFREQIKSARLIANPGCYPTAAILSLYPAIKEGFIEATGIHIASASGVSGAGKNAKLPFHHPELDQNYFAYRVGSHQHSPEINSILSRVTGAKVSSSFVPHVLPIRRGILSTMFCRKKGNAALQQIWDAYNSYYEKEMFIRLYALGEAPNLQAVCGSNFVDISLHQDQITGEVIIVAAEDNLCKGAAGQAVQNMNIMMGFPEGMGLSHPGTL